MYDINVRLLSGIFQFYAVHDFSKVYIKDGFSFFFLSRPLFSTQDLKTKKVGNVPILHHPNEKVRYVSVLQNYTQI